MGSKSGTRQKMDPGVHDQLLWEESVTRAYCWREQLCHVQVLWQRLSIPYPEPSATLGVRGEEGPCSDKAPTPRGHDNALLCGLLDAQALEFSS